jgi:hypothetical protein
MSLSDLFGASLEAPVAAIRRYVICYAIAAAAAIGALIYAASAATRALEIALGPVEARAIVALALALIAVGGFVAPRLIAKANRDDPSENSSAQARVKAMSREEKIAMVLEALRFGFAMGSRKPASQSNDGRK